MPEERFAFAVDDRFRPLLLGLGVVPSRCHVTLTADDHLDVRFGPWRCRTPLANVADASITGPYRWWRAVGARLSFSDRGATFATTPAGGVCLRFHEPVAALDPMGVLRHPGLTVTVADRAGFLAAVRRRAHLDGAGPPP
jgi:hypothetical protein